MAWRSSSGASKSTFGVPWAGKLHSLPSWPVAAQIWPRLVAIRHTAGVPTSPTSCRAGAMLTRPSVSIDTASVSPLRKSAWVATTQKPVLAACSAPAPARTSGGKCHSRRSAAAAVEKVRG